MVRILSWNWSGSPSGMRAKHLRFWLEAATIEESLHKNHWRKFILIIQVEFHNVFLQEEFTQKTAMMLPKGNRGLWRIGLFEV